MNRQARETPIVRASIIKLLVGVFFLSCAADPSPAPIVDGGGSSDLVAACSVGAPCTPANRCHQGTVSCSGGTPVCVDSGKLARAVPGCGPVAYWPMDDSGADEAGGRDLTLVGGPGFAVGVLGSALSLNGNAQQYAIRQQNGLPINDPEFNLVGTDFTIQVWLFYYNLTNEQTFLEKFEARTGPAWTMTKLASNQLVFSWSTDSISAAPALPPQTWLHIVLRRTQLEFQLLLNGRTVATKPVQVIQATPVPLLVGRRNMDDGRDFPMNGRIDEVAIWKRALSDQEVSFLYNAGRGRKASEVN